MIKRVGFACKWIDRPDQVDGLHPKDDAKQYNTGGTTMTWLGRQTKEVAEQKLWDVVQGNITALHKLVERVGTLDEQLRMVRLSSDVLPVYTHPEWSYFYQLPDVRDYIEKGFARVGDTARSAGVRLSFHPGQFVVLASDNQDIVNRSIEEFEYHTSMASWMGYGQKFQDFKINVHIAGRAGCEGFRQAYNRLSSESKNCITIENEEMKYGLDDCLGVSDIVPIVLDIHHHWVREGEYLSPDDDRVKRVIDSWRGVRPTCHYSVSREDALGLHSKTVAPDYQLLMEAGRKRSHLRAHSDFYWNDAVNKWAASFNDQFDIMCESKAKNLASIDFYNNYCK